MVGVYADLVGLNDDCPAIEVSAWTISLRENSAAGPKAANVRSDHGLIVCRGDGLIARLGIGIAENASAPQGASR